MKVVVVITVLLAFLSFASAQSCSIVGVWRYENQSEPWGSLTIFTTFTNTNEWRSTEDVHVHTSGMDCHCILALEGNYTLSGTTLKFADTHCVNGGDCGDSCRCPSKNETNGLAQLSWASDCRSFTFTEANGEHFTFWKVIGPQEYPHAQAGKHKSARRRWF